MALVQDVLDALQLVSDSIDNMQAITDAVRNGVGYLKSHHPEAERDLLAMCDEITKTLDALAVASAVVTRFAFTVSGSNLDAEPRVFNDYFINHVGDIADVRRSIDALRGHCHVIEQHAQRLEAIATKRGLRSFTHLIGITSQEQDAALHQALQQIYDEEREFMVTVHAMPDAVERALADVQSQLGPPGKMDVANVPAAAARLGAYAAEFGQLQSKCLTIGGALKLLIRESTLH